MSTEAGKTDYKAPTTGEIRSAFKENDGSASKRLHDQKNTTDANEIVLEIQQTMEQHKALGDYVKSIIYGGLDGIITTFAIVAGIAGADLEVEVVLVLGFANLIADGLSMGIGDYLSEVSEIEYINSEKKREEWEFENYKEGEIQEMIEIYKEKGVTKADAETILRTMSKYPEFFINHVCLLYIEYIKYIHNICSIVNR